MSESNEKPVREIPAAVPEEIRLWASLGVAAMLARVRSVCITEYGWMIDELREG